MRYPRFRTLILVLLLLLSFILLAVFSVTMFMQAQSVIDRQTETHALSLVARYEDRLQDYLKQVEAETQAISADSERLNHVFKGDLESFQRSLSRWEEGYENIHYDFTLISFPEQERCHLSRSYVPELSDLSCESLLGAHQGGVYQGWSILQIGAETLAVYSVPWDLASSGKVVGYLMTGIRLGNNRYLLNHMLSPSDQMQSLQLHKGSVVLSRLDLQPEVAVGLVEARSAGLTSLGREIYLSLSLYDSGQSELRQGLGNTLVYSVILVLLVSLLMALWLSTAVDRQLQQLISFTRLANRDLNTHWPETPIQEFNEIGREVVEIVHCLKDRELELEAVNSELSANVLEKRRILQHLIQTQENERRRLSNELHDDMAQLLVAVKMNLQLLRDEMKDEAGQNQNLEQAVHLVNTIYDNVYHRIRMLRPYELNDFGLGVSLKALPAISILEQMDYAVEMDICQEQPLRTEVTSNLYRIAQEALSNVIKYAKGTYVLVRLRDEEHGLRLTIADDGKGGEGSLEHKATEQGGFGLLAIRERAEYLNGTLILTAAEGVSVDLFIPAEYAYSSEAKSQRVADSV